MNEFDLIDRYFAPLSRDGLKNDAAVLQIPPGQELVVTSDTLNAGTHFFADAAPGDIARKALRVNLSDLAAMGADPLSYQLNIAFPEMFFSSSFRRTPGSSAIKPKDPGFHRDDARGLEWLEEFTSALAVDQKTFGIFCSGGDTTSIKGPLSISITALGLIPAGKSVSRAGAQDGDAVMLSGPVGDALIGLKTLRQEMAGPDAKYFIDRYYNPRPRLDLSELIRTHAHAAIDISDGLVADLGHICAASGLTGTIDLDKISFTPPAQALLDQDRITAQDLLTGGDDYELLLAVPPDSIKKLEAVGCRVIGRFATGKAVPLVMDKDGQIMAITHTGWTHF